MKNSLQSLATMTKSDQTAFDVNRPKRGTREWSDHSYNIALGCSHDCHYCYAKAMARRFDRIASAEDWRTMTFDSDKVRHSARRFGGVVMFPTTHDITPETIVDALETLQNLLGARNQVLIVTKPHLSVIKRLCTELLAYRNQIQFRFTIGSLSTETCALWEPGAPPPVERVKSLEHAFREGYATSISMEPMLGCNDEVCALVARVAPFVTGAIWLGKLNGGISTAAQSLPGVKESVCSIRAGQCDNEILALHSALVSHSKVQWKDSVKKVLRNHKIIPKPCQV